MVPTFALVLLDCRRSSHMVSRSHDLPLTAGMNLGAGLRSAAPATDPAILGALLSSAHSMVQGRVRAFGPLGAPAPRWPVQFTLKEGKAKVPGSRPELFSLPSRGCRCGGSPARRKRRRQRRMQADPCRSPPPARTATRRRAHQSVSSSQDAPVGQRRGAFRRTGSQRKVPAGRRASRSRRRWRTRWCTGSGGRPGGAGAAVVRHLPARQSMSVNTEARGDADRGLAARDRAQTE